MTFSVWIRGVEFPLSIVFNPPFILVVTTESEELKEKGRCGHKKKGQMLY